MNVRENTIISSAYDFFQIVHAQNMLHLDCGERAYLQYYRGQANKEWGLLPSISRSSLLRFEGDLIREYISKRPEEFNAIKNRFNLITKMQHYGLVTRLLDMTANPAVALFFACNGHFDSDGEVFVFSTTRDEILDSTVLDIIMRFYFEEKDEYDQFDLFSYLQKCLPKYKREQLERSFYFLISNYPAIASTEWISERMSRQSSAFLILPFKAINQRWEECRKIGRTGLYEYLKETGCEEYAKNTKIYATIDDVKEGVIKYEQNGSRFIVMAKDKKKILRELKTIGISRSYIFPELEYEGKGIVEEFLYLTQSEDA